MRNRDERISLVAIDDTQQSANPVAISASAIGPGKRVTLHFALYLREGELIDSNFDKPPVVFTVGDGNLLPGFEQALYGLEAGAQQDVLLNPAQAFGAINDDNIQRFPRYRFPPDLALCRGLVVDFGDASGNTQAGVVGDFDAATVCVDFNHPLAGRHIRFSVHIHRVENEEAI